MSTQKKKHDLRFNCAAEVMDIYRKVTEASEPEHQLPKEYTAHGKLIQVTIEEEYGKLARAFDVKYPTMPLAHVMGVHALSAGAIGMCLGQMVVRMSDLLLEQSLDLPGLRERYAVIRADKKVQLFIRHLLFQMLMQNILAKITSSAAAHLHAESIMLEQNEEEKERKPLIH